MADEAAIACGLERYWLTKGAYPPALDGFAPEYIPVLPNDALTGEPYRYRLDSADTVSYTHLDVYKRQRVSSIFVPVVVLIAAATAVAYGLHGGWEPGIINAAAVLIVACPCAMGLATPAAIMAGTNAAAKNGILVRDGSALEKCGTITAVLFDKTGTLTEGKPRMEKFATLAGNNDGTCLLYTSRCV